MSRKYTMNEKFLINDSKEKYWLLGLMAADGNVKDHLSFSLSQSGKHGLDMINYVKTKLSYNGVIYKYKNAHSLTISNKKGVEVLKNHGIIINKTLTFKPKRIKFKYVKSFLRGYFEGDGSVGVYKNNKGIKYLCCSFVGTQEMIDYCLPKIPKKYRVRKIKRCKNLIEIRYNGKNAINFLKWLFKEDLYIGKKYNIFSNYIKSNPRVLKYEKLKKDAKMMYNNNLNCIEIAKKLDCNFQLIYKWKDDGFK